jgi:hypothetical protein
VLSISDTCGMSEHSHIAAIEVLKDNQQWRLRIDTITCDYTSLEDLIAVLHTIRN